MPTATLIVSRTSARDMKFRGIEVLLDGDFIGELSYGKSLEREIEPGIHTLKVTNRMKSASGAFEAAEGETVEFVATAIALAGCWFFLTMMGTVAYRVTLERV
jgi:hypothetical protein